MEEKREKEWDEKGEAEGSEGMKRGSCVTLVVRLHYLMTRRWGSLCERPINYHNGRFPGTRDAAH